MAAIINHLLWAEDFEGYGSTAALKAAYPGEDGFNEKNFDETSSDWGATAGPDGQAGIVDVSPFTHDTGSIERSDLVPTCYGFRIKGRFDFSSSHLVLTSHYLFSMGWVTALDAAPPIVQITRVHATSTLRVVFRTIPPYGNALGGTAYTEDFIGLLPASTPVTVEAYGRRSTITEASPGVFAPDTDGELHVLLDGVEVFAFAGPLWNARNDLNETPYWNSISYHPIGRLSEIEVYDEVGCETTEPPPCECEPPPTSPPKLPPIIPRRPPKTPPIIGMQLECLGGGIVPIQPDLVYVENWWGL